MILNFGINNPGIAYEVALEVLGQRMQPLIMAIVEEKTKPTPSEAMIAYCEARKTAISLMQDGLNPDDHETIAAILDKNDPRAHFFFAKNQTVDPVPASVLILFRYPPARWQQRFACPNDPREPSDLACAYPRSATRVVRRHILA